MPKIIRISHFPDDPQSHGGARRTSQLSEILFEGKVDNLLIKYPDLIKKYGTGVKKTSFIQAVRAQNQYIKISTTEIFDSRKRIDFHTKILIYQQCHHVFKKAAKDGLKLVLLENTRPELWFIPVALKNLGIPFIGLPHNLESFVIGEYSQISGLSSPNWVHEEMELLKKSELNYCISNNDSLFAALYQAKAQYLPYYPVESKRKELLEIRNKRKTSEKYYFMVGSASNPPTLEGMQKIINKFSNLPDKKLVIAGFNTNKIESTKSPNILLLGEISNDELDKHLASCTACIIDQSPSTGALTKITELRFAGVPMICNNWAARDFFNLSGIYVYYCDEELDTILKIENLQTPEIPKIDQSLNRQFTEYCKTLVGQ